MLEDVLWEVLKLIILLAVGAFGLAFFAWIISKRKERRQITVGASDVN